VTITTPLLLVLCHPVARIGIAHLCTKIWRLYVQPFQWYDWSPQIF